MTIWHNHIDWNGGISHKKSKIEMHLTDMISIIKFMISLKKNLTYFAFSNEIPIYELVNHKQSQVICNYYSNLCLLFAMNITNICVILLTFANFYCGNDVFVTRYNGNI